MTSIDHPAPGRICTNLYQLGDFAPGTQLPQHAWIVASSDRQNCRDTPAKSVYHHTQTKGKN